MKLIQICAFGALAYTGEIDYDNSREVSFNEAEKGRSFGSAPGSGLRSYSMRKDMISAILAARGLPYFYYHFHDYGCYCIAQNMETNPLKNRGKPLDEVDAVCQAHSKCQQCVYADSNGSINPKSTGYQMTIDRVNGDITCDGKDSYPKKFQQNGTWLARYNACLCDRELAVGLADMAAANKHNAKYEDHNGSLCGVKTKPVRVTSALEAGLGSSRGESASVQMNQVMNAAFESMTGNIELMTGTGQFETIGSGKDAFVSENVAQCCGTYPKRVPIPHYGQIGAQQCCDGELRPNGSC